MPSRKAAFGWPFCFNFFCDLSLLSCSDPNGADACGAVVFVKLMLAIVVQRFILGLINSLLKQVYTMRYFIHDPKSGRWFVDERGFHTYDHNQATRFTCYETASRAARSVGGYVETL
tara:strand:+ start:157618 stop:157968 length:351 start_codon:yes stop_codon:yes gene_type:complete